MAKVAWDNPCEVVKALKEAYYQLSSGNKAASVSYQSMGVIRSTTYSIGDLSELKQAMTMAEAECAALQGRTPTRRHAIVFGARRFSQ